MKKASAHNEYEQLAIDFGGSEVSTEAAGEESKPKKERAKPRELELGTAVVVNPETKRFCDGRGIPDYARKAYIKRINHESKTIVIETEPGGKELGLLFMSDVVPTR